MGACGSSDTSETSEAPTMEKKHHISDKCVDEYIDRLLGDKKVNITLLPDAIEHRVYKNVIITLLHALSSTFDQTKISILGHDITMHITPTPTLRPDRRKGQQADSNLANMVPFGF
jgi:hypothetical protein